MKRWIGFLLALCLLPAGCSKPAEIDKTSVPWVVPSELLGQPIKEALQKDWDWWNGLSTEQKLLSSRMGAASGSREFGSWSDCETFVGLTVPNPLENSDWLEKGTYVGMPIGFADAPRMEVHWHGSEEGHLCMVTLCAGYYTGDVRLQLWAKVYGDPAEAGESRHIEDAMRSEYLEETGGTGVYIKGEVPGQQGCCEGMMAKGHVLYYVNVVGPDDQPEASRKVLDQVLELLETVELE